jgi:hypothetical protein
VQCQSSRLPTAKRGAAGNLRYQHTQHKRTRARSYARTRTHARARARACTYMLGRHGQKRAGHLLEGNQALEKSRRSTSWRLTYIKICINPKPNAPTLDIY